MRESSVQNNFLTPSQWLSQFLSSRNLDSVTENKLVVCIEESIFKMLMNIFNFKDVNNRLSQIYGA